jgi:hypothetical protein
VIRSSANGGFRCLVRPIFALTLASKSTEESQAIPAQAKHDTICGLAHAEGAPATRPTFSRSSTRAASAATAATTLPASSTCRVTRAWRAAPPNSTSMTARDQRASPPTRLDIDGHSVRDWRAKVFFDTVAGTEPARMLLMQLVGLRARHPALQPKKPVGESNFCPADSDGTRGELPCPDRHTARSATNASHPAALVALSG